MAPQTNMMTVADLLMAYRLASTTDRRREDPRYARWWVARLGTLPLSELTPARLEQALEHLESEGRGGSTVASYLRFFRRVTKWGTGATALSADPCAGMPLPKETTLPMRVVTEEEETRLCQALGTPYHWWLKFALLTGLEPSEQFTLLWKSVDLTRGVVLLPQGTTGAMVELSLPPEAVTIVRALRQAYPASLWVFPDPQHSRQPANHHNFYESRWTPTVQRLGLPRLTWRDLHHTCGVRLAKQGVPVGAIATFLRQRELRCAYYYRAWQPGVAPMRHPPNPPHVPVFTDLTDVELRALWAREATDHPLTFGDVCRLYAVHFLRQRPSRVQFERLYTQFFHRWADRPLAEISRKEVRVWYMSLAQTPSHATKALNFLKRVYGVALEMEVYDGPDPTFKIRPYPSIRRERFLSLEEVQRFMEGIPHLPPKQGAYFLMLLLTGARLSEVRCLRWTDVEWSTRLWKKSRTKNGTTQFIPLPVQVIEALGRLPRTSEWVFPGKKGRPWCTANPQKLWGWLRRRWQMEDVRIHDLRRSCASYLSIAGENLPTIQNVLNHRSLAHTSIYARLNTKAVDRALQAQADRLCRVTQGPEVLPALTHNEPVILTGG